MATVLITGVGLVSSRLGKMLTSKGNDVKYLSQSPEKINNTTIFKWDISNGFIDLTAFRNVDYIVHLAGYGISQKRWTKETKSKILNSRIQSTALLFKSVKEKNIPLKGFIAASAVGYYGTINSNVTFKENNRPGNDFLASVCEKWEDASLKFNDLNIKTTILRTGVVFSNSGGALDKIIKPIKLNFGAVLGNGKQIIPWIHIDDLCNLYIETMTNEKMQGIYNAVAPANDTNKKVTELIAEKLNKKIILPNIPEFILKLILGEIAPIVLYGSKISSKKLKELNFNFNYPTLDKALTNLIIQP